MSLSDDTTMEVLTGLRRRVDLDAASRLRLDDDIVYSVVFRRLHDGVPFVMTTVHLTPAVAHAVLSSPELQDGAVGTQTVIGVLEPHLIEPIAEAAQSITVAPADSAVADAVSCELGHSDAASRPAVQRHRGPPRRIVRQPLPARAVHLPSDVAPLRLVQFGCAVTLSVTWHAEFTGARRPTPTAMPSADRWSGRSAPDRPFAIARSCG